MTAAEERVPANYTRLDNTLPHQIRIGHFAREGTLHVTCTCHHLYRQISTAEQALAIWHQHFEENQ